MKKSIISLLLVLFMFPFFSKAEETINENEARDYLKKMSELHIKMAGEAESWDKSQIINFSEEKIEMTENLYNQGKLSEKEYTYALKVFKTYEKMDGKELSTTFRKIANKSQELSLSSRAAGLGIASLGILAIYLGVKGQCWEIACVIFPIAGLFSLFVGGFALFAGIMPM